MVEGSPARAGAGEQAALFPDASLPDELVGYRGHRRMPDRRHHLPAAGLLGPHLAGRAVDPHRARARVSQRLYSFKDILVLKVVKRLLDTGVSLQNIRVAVDHLRRRGVADLARITLFSDGTTVYECTSPEEVVDLLQGGQGVFGIAVSGAMREISGTIHEFPAERADGGELELVTEDELARHRRHAAPADRQT